MGSEMCIRDRFCRDLSQADAWPASGLDFFYMGVHGKGVSLAPFRDLPFGRVGWSYASNDCTMRRAAQDDLPAYLAQVREELPPQGVVYEIAGGNHEQYGSYGSPGPAQGLAYKDLPASITVQGTLTATNGFMLSVSPNASWPVLRVGKDLVIDSTDPSGAS